MITITTRQWATIKRVAQSVQPMVQKKDNLYKKIQELAEEYKTLEAQIEGFEHGIKAMCEGLGTEDLVERKITIVEGKTDKDGRPLKKTSYEPTSIVQYNELTNNYTITPTVENPNEPTNPTSPNNPNDSTNLTNSIEE